MQHLQYTLKMGNDIKNANNLSSSLNPPSPPYRMPPEPPGANNTVYSDATIPGSTVLETNSEKYLLNHNGIKTQSANYQIKNEKVPSKIQIMNDRMNLHLLSRPMNSAVVAPDHPPKQILAWNSQNNGVQTHMQQDIILGNQTGAIPRTPARLPEDVTALAERENNKDLKDSKSAVFKTYHTLKDLISARFKKETAERSDELNNVITQQANLSNSLPQNDELRSPYSALPVHMRKPHGLNQSQPNIWKEANVPMLNTNQVIGQRQNYTTEMNPNGIQHRAASQPHLNTVIDRRGFQSFPLSNEFNQEVPANITDSDDGGFAAQARRPQTVLHTSSIQQHQQQPHQHQQQSQVQMPHSILMQNPGNSALAFRYNSNNNLLNSNINSQANSYHSQQQQQHYIQQQQPHVQQYTQEQVVNAQQTRNVIPQSYSEDPQNNRNEDAEIQVPAKILPRNDIKSKLPNSTPNSDYEKSGNQSSNVDSGRGSVVYSSGHNSKRSAENSDSVARRTDNNSEWVDIVDVELRNILEPAMQNMSIRPESTVSGSASSVTPPLPPLSPDNTKTKINQSTDSNKPEYGMDSYNRPGRSAAPIGPSKAGWPSSSLHKQLAHKMLGKTQEQSLLKRHLFGLDNDQTSTTTRSLDLESILGGPWGAVSDSETDTQGLRHVRSQLEGLEHMYSEVLKMLGSKDNPNTNRINDSMLRSARRRHGSISSLPSSSVSNRPIRDRRRTEERRKVRDIKGINRRFQRLESHVVTLARSVAHLSSEMRSQHLVMQELERLRDDLTSLRTQAVRSQALFALQSNEREPPNLTNPKRVQKLTNFFGEDPPLMRLFLKKLGYEKYADLLESERVGMIELPYIGEERLQKLGVPLGPRLRILQEAQISLCKDTTLCIV